MKKLTEIFTKDPILKIGALLTSILIWFICMNITDPVEKRPFQVGLILMNETALSGNQRVLMNGSSLSGKPITVTLEGPRSALDSLDRARLSAYIDFKLAEILYAPQTNEPITASVRSDLPPEISSKGIQVTNISPSTVDISLDKIVTMTKAITKNIIGDVADGYKSRAVVITPETIYITGPQLSLANIGSVRAEYDLNSATENVHDTAKIKLYDWEGKVFTDDSVSLSDEDVSIDVEVNRIAKIPVTQPEIVGTIPDNYEISIEYEPRYIEIVGSEEELKNIKFITPERIDVTGFTESKDLKLDIRGQFINTGLDVVDGSTYTLDVHVIVNKLIEAEYVIPIDKVNISGYTNDTEISADSVAVTLKGIESVINALTPEKINAWIVLDHLEPGEHRIKVTFVVPTNVEIVSDDLYIDVLIKAQDEEAETAQDTENPATETP